MADVVKREVYKLIDKELDAANQKFPLFASNHEEYAVLLEEAEEAAERVAEIEGLMNVIWEYTRANEAPEFLHEQYTEVFRQAADLAAEAIQCAAMARKAIISNTDMRHIDAAERGSE